MRRRIDLRHTHVLRGVLTMTALLKWEHRLTVRKYDRGVFFSSLWIHIYDNVEFDNAASLN